MDTEKKSAMQKCILHAFNGHNCSICVENDRVTEAQSYCQKCERYMCLECLSLHNQMFKNHVVVNSNERPRDHDLRASQTVLETCEVHTDERIKLFCEDHSILCCYECLFSQHRKCQVVRIVQKARGFLTNTDDFKCMALKIKGQQQNLDNGKRDMENHLNSIQVSRNKVLAEINDLRKQINVALDKLTRNTVTKLDAMATDMQSSVKPDIDRYNKFYVKLDFLSDVLKDKEDMDETLACITYHKCFFLTNNIDCLLKEVADKPKQCIMFKEFPEFKQVISTVNSLGMLQRTTNQIESNLAENTVNVLLKESSNSSSIEGNIVEPSTEYTNNQTDLQYDDCRERISADNLVTEPNSEDCGVNSDSECDGQIITKLADAHLAESDQGIAHETMPVSHPDKILKVGSNKKYLVKIPNDERSCRIECICEMSSGELLILDRPNKKVKLLDHSYSVITHIRTNESPWHMCIISSSEVCVTVDDKLHEVLFLRVNDGQISADRVIPLMHVCRGIAYDGDFLYITSRTSLYKYTLEGTQIAKLYEDCSETYTVYKCAVNPMNDRIFVTNYSHHKILTLTKDGGLTATLSDPDLRFPCDTHVTSSGQVVICGIGSHSVVQVDRNGEKCLSILLMFDHKQPVSVCFSHRTNTLVVGIVSCDEIMVFKTV